MISKKPPQILKTPDETSLPSSSVGKKGSGGKRCSKFIKAKCFR